MPTYGFRCPEGHEFDRFYKTISAAPADLECPECGRKAERMLHGGAGLLFKGSGFYLTDYGKNAHRPQADGGKPDAGKAESGKSEAGKTETAAKAETPKAEKPKPKAETKPAKKPKGE